MSQLDIIAGMYSWDWEGHEWMKWCDEDLMWDGDEVLTLCDVRRRVEKVFGVWIYSNQQILNAINTAGWRIATRWLSNSHIVSDLCLVNLQEVMRLLMLI